MTSFVAEVKCYSLVRYQVNRKREEKEEEKKLQAWGKEETDKVNKVTERLLTAAAAAIIAV